jgi:hypothetical protein
MKDFLKTHWKEPYGDRQQEMVFIGIEQDQEKMIAMLDDLLLTDEEFELGHEVWTTDKVRFEDRFPEEFSEHLHKKHLHIMSGDADKQEGWEDCLEEDDGEEEKEEEDK